MILYQHVNELPSLPSKMNPKISSEMEAVILKALEKDPAKRFSFAEEMKEALKEIPLEPRKVVEIKPEPLETIEIPEEAIFKKTPPKKEEPPEFKKFKTVPAYSESITQKKKIPLPILLPVVLFAFVLLLFIAIPSLRESFKGIPSPKRKVASSEIMKSGEIASKKTETTSFQQTLKEPEKREKPTFSLLENFDGKSLRNISFIENGKWTLQNGVLHFDGGDKLGDAITFVQRKFSNFSISVETSRLSGPYSSQGIIFRADDNFKNGYLFQIYTGRPGMFSVWKIVNGEFQALSHWQNSNVVKVGFEKWNSIMVEARGANFSFYINGNLVVQISDGTFKSGRIGLWTKGKAGGGGEVLFDNLVLKAD